MNFNPYQNNSAGIAALGPVQAMSDRNEAQTYMANGGQMFASGGIARLASGGLDSSANVLPKYKYDPATQRYTLQGADEAATAMEEELLRKKRAAEAAGGSGSSGSFAAESNYARPSGQRLGESLASAGIGLSKSPLSFLLPFGLGRLPGYLGERYIENRLNEAAKLGGHTGTYTGYAAFGDRPNNTMTEAQTQEAIAGTGGGPLSGPAWGASSISGLPSGYEGVGGPGTYSSPSATGGGYDFSGSTGGGLGGVGGEGTPGSNGPGDGTAADYAQGGLAALARGGMSHLGDYSDGGRLLRGPGDGVSDSIPATIGNKRPARLADGEFVIPARIVSELGNGSTEAGARKLYAMMDRIQKARGKTVGRGRVAVNSRAEKNLPA
jgi:hypothetical protein